MKIGGFQPLSLNDYPGRVAAVVFTRGCNFRCPFCHNPELLDMDAAAPVAWSPADVLGELSRRRRLLDGVVISGGEPTLQDDLAQFIGEIRETGLSVKLDTNGSRPEILEHLFSRRLVDAVAMDIKAPWSRYEELTGCRPPLSRLRRSIKLIAGSGLPHQFRTTVVESLLTSDDLEQIAAMVPCGSPHSRQPFIDGYCLDPRLRREERQEAVDGKARPGDFLVK